MINTYDLNVRFIGDVTDVTIFYDVMALDKYLGDGKMYEYILNQWQYCGEDALLAGTQSVRLNFNHPITKMVFYCDKPVTDVVMKFNGTVEIPVTKKINSVYEYTFTKSVNFSRIDIATLHVTASEPTSLHVFAESLNVCRFGRGMMGLVFSK